MDGAPRGRAHIGANMRWRMQWWNYRASPMIPSDNRAFTRARTGRWQGLAVATFVTAVLALGTAIAIPVLIDSAAQRRIGLQALRQHRLEAVVTAVARESMVASRIAPLGEIAGLSMQLRERVQDQPGMTIRIVDPAGAELGSSWLSDAPRMPASPAFVVSMPVDDAGGHVVAYVQGSLSPMPVQGAGAIVLSALPRDWTFWMPLFWFGGAMAILCLAAWRYAWWSGPMVRDAVTSRMIDALLHDDYRTLWRVGGRGGFLAAVSADAADDVDRARIAARAVQRVTARWHTLRERSGILDRTETDPAWPPLRAACLSNAAGGAAFAQGTVTTRIVVPVGAQTRWFALLCGIGAGSLAGLLGQVGASVMFGAYAVVCLAAGWGLHRLWAVDRTVHDVSPIEALLQTTALPARATPDVEAGAASFGMHASGIALWIGVAVASLMGVRMWPALLDWPAALLPATILVMVGYLLREAVSCTWCVHDITRHDPVYIDVCDVRDLEDVASRPYPHAGKGACGTSSLFPRAGDGGCKPRMRARIRARRDVIAAVAVGALIVGPGLSCMVVSGWPFAVTVLALTCLPMMAAVQAWRWQAVASPWQRAARRSIALRPRAPVRCTSTPVYDGDNGDGNGIHSGPP
ncbi:hypothetical protein [Robbsia andropogonis]|uniref:hypothetical protein n=1 Tax=Robbsia andropogonis TaxID=28092 RepID=UPI00209D35C1|nr:hypothetical protein [Robbsia andropogonis]MCP1117097.1 hypothetical protein [Robbsia andropogonis]MCP1128443.1 hypothetical protein [Robbsia andropogonis]